MSNEKKTHYRKVFKSDHLGVADLEEFLEEKQRLVFTIKEVKQYTIEDSIKNSGIVVAGRRVSANIAYFIEPIKPLVLNATNSKVVKSFAPSKSSFVEDWNNIIIELYIDASVKMKGDIVGGVRIKTIQPAKTKPVLDENHKQWSKVAIRVSEGVTLEELNKHYTLTQENYDKLCL